MSLSQQQLQHLRSLNDAAAICAIARIESLEKAASEQELRERTQNINTEQRFHELQARVAAISFEALQYKKQIEDLEAQVSSLVSKEKELLARHSDASLAAARESSKAKRLEQQVDELHRDKAELTAAAQRRLEQLDAASSELERITNSLQQATTKISELESAGVLADRLLREKDLEAENSRVSLRMEIEFEKANELKLANDRASKMRREMIAEMEDLKRTLSSKISECEAANARSTQDSLLQSQRRDELLQAKSQVIELKADLRMQEALHKQEIERRDELLKILEQEKVRLESEKDRIERNRSALDGQLKGALAEFQAQKLAFAEEKAALQSSTQEAVVHAKSLSEELASLSQLRGAIQNENVSFASAQTLLMLSPAAAAASIDRDGSLSKTELYAKYIEALKVLHTERQERVKVEREFAAVVAVMEETGPQVQQELQEGQIAKGAISDMQDRLDKAVRDNLQKRREIERCADHIQKLDRENQLFDTNCRRLQKQLRHALRQNELLRTNQSMEPLSSLPSDPDSVIDYVWELGGDTEQALLKNEQLQRMIDAMQSDSEKEMLLRKEQRIKEAESETMKLRREMDEMRDAREKQMSLFKALNERCESFKAQLQHRSPAASAAAVNITDSPLFQQLLQDKEKLQAEFDSFKESRFSTSRDEIEKLRQLLHSAQHAAALAQGKLEGVLMERDTYKSDLASRADELPQMREKCAKADAIASQAEANAQMHARACVQAEERVKALEFQLHQATMRAEHERARCESVEKDKEALRGEVQRMQELVSKCHASFDYESKHRLAELSRLRDEAQEREAALHKARDDMSTARLAAEEHQHSQTKAINLLQMQLDDAERRAKSASDSTSAMKARISSLENSLSEANVRIFPASSQRPLLPSTCGTQGELDHSMASEITSLQEQLCAAQNERDTYYRMSGEFECELLASSGALKDLQAKLDAANAQLEQQAQQLADEVKKSSAAAAEVASMLPRLQAQLQLDLDAANRRAAAAESAAVSAKEEMEVQIARANNLLQAEAAARAIAASERTRLEAMTQDHAAGISRAQSLQKSLSESEESLFRLRSELDREKEVAASSLAAAASASKELMDKVRGLETRLLDLQQQNSLLENQLQRLERSLTDHGSPDTEAPENERALRAYAERERDRLKQQLEVSEATSRRLKFQLDSKEREAAELQTEVESSRHKLSLPCYTQVDLDRLSNLQKQVSLLTESNEHLRSQESTAKKLALQWEERYNCFQSEMMKLRQEASLHSQLLASAEGQRDEYSKQVSELRDQYSRISSKNQDVDPLVHEELKKKNLESEKENERVTQKYLEIFDKLTAKSEELKNLKREMADSTQKLHAAEQEAHSKQQQQLQLQQQREAKDQQTQLQHQKDLQQAQNMLQELKQQHQQQQAKDQHTISHLEKTISELKQDLAQSKLASAVVGAVVEPAVRDSSVGTSQPLNPAACAQLSVPVSQAANINTAAAEFFVDSQFQSAAAATPVPVSAFNTDSAAGTENSGEKRSSDNDLGAKQTKRVRFGDLSGSDPVANCVTTAFSLKVQGFSPGESFTNDVGRALFPNQKIVGIRFPPGKSFGFFYFETDESLEAALALGSSRNLREGVVLTVQRAGKRNSPAATLPKAADSMASPTPFNNPFSLPSPTHSSIFSASSAVSSQPFAFTKPPPPPGDPPAYSSASSSFGFSSSSQLGGSNSGFGFASGQSTGFSVGNFLPAFGASSNSTSFASNPFSAQTSAVVSSLPVFGGVSTLKNPVSSSPAVTASLLPSEAPPVSQPVSSSSAGVQAVTSAATVTAATPSDTTPVLAPSVSRVAKLPKASANVLGTISAASAQVTPVEPVSTPATVVSRSELAVASANSDASEFLASVSEPAASSLGATSAATVTAATPSDTTPVPAPSVSRLPKTPKASANVLGIIAAPTQSAPVLPAAPSAAALPSAASSEAKLSSNTTATMPPPASAPAAASLVPQVTTIRQLPRRVPTSAPIVSTTALPAALASAPVAASPSTAAPSSTDEDDKKKRIAEKLAARKTVMEQAAPAAVAPEPIASAPEPIASAPEPIASAPVIVTPQPIGFTAVPVMNFGSVFNLQTANPFLAMAPGGSAAAAGFSFAPFAPSVFGNDAAVSKPAATSESSAEEDAQPENPE